METKMVNIEGKPIYDGGKMTERYHDDLYDLVLPEPKLPEPTSTEEIEDKLLSLAQEADDLSLKINNLEVEAEITRLQRASMERQAKDLAERSSKLRSQLHIVTNSRAHYTLKLEASEGRN